MSSQITYDPAYNTVGRDDFKSLIEVDRYGDRSTAFDAIISATEDQKATIRSRCGAQSRIRAAKIGPSTPSARTRS